MNCAGFAQDPNTIYKGRYVISGSGDVVDLQSKSLANDGDKKLKEVIGDSLLYCESWIMDEEEGFSFFSLKTGKFTPILNGSFYTKGGLYAPDYRHSLQYNIYKKGKNLFFSAADKIVLSSIDKRSKVIVPYCHPTRRTSDITMGFPEIPMIWVDNETILYADYPYMYSHLGIKSPYMVVIKKLNIVSLNTDTIALIDSVMPDRYNGFFQKDQGGNLIFYCQKGDYIIDIAHKKVTPRHYYEFGNGFKEDYNEGKGDVILYFEGKEISRDKNYSQTLSTAGYLATVVYPFSLTEQEPYLGVWSVMTKEWVFVEIPWICNVIGWLEESN